MPTAFFFKFPWKASLGGAERQTLEMAKEYQAKNYKTKLFTSDAKLFRLFEKNKLPRRRLFVGWEPTSKPALLLWLVTFFVGKGKFKNICRVIPPDSIIFCHGLIEKLILTPLTKAKVVWLEHKVPGPWLKRNPLKYRFLNLGRKVKILTVSQFAEREFIKFGLPEKNIEVIYPRFQTAHSSFKVPNSKFFTIGLLSRLAPEKGIKDFVNLIIPQLKNRPQWQVLIGGEGEEAHTLKQTISNSGFTDRIKLLGLINNLDEFFSQISVFVYPSKVPESFGIAVLEAMVRGLPVIASDIGALREIITPEGSGFLINPNHPENFIAALKKLNDPPTYLATRKQALERAQYFLSNQFPFPV